VIAAVALAGCGAPAVHRQHRRAPSKIAIAQADHEYPAPAPPRQRVSAAGGSPAVAVTAFARAYINWSADSVAADMASLAARSIGQARAAAQLAAAETASDYELHRDGIANSGAVEAVAALAGAAHQFVVVTRERTTATATAAYQGLEPAWHVAIATVSQIGPGAWVVSGWQPQS
jgi:hypothetical protein